MTLTALIRLFTRVNTLVYFKITFSSKAFTAVTALKTLFSLVGQHMPYQVASLLRCL